MQVSCRDPGLGYFSHQGLATLGKCFEGVFGDIALFCFDLIYILTFAKSAGALCHRISLDRKSKLGSMLGFFVYLVVI